MGIYVFGQWPGMLALALTIMVSSLTHFQQFLARPNTHTQAHQIQITLRILEPPAAPKATRGPGSNRLSSPSAFLKIPYHYIEYTPSAFIYIARDAYCGKPYKILQAKRSVGNFRINYREQLYRATKFPGSLPVVVIQATTTTKSKIHLAWVLENNGAVVWVGIDCIIWVWWIEGIFTDFHLGYDTWLGGFDTPRYLSVWRGAQVARSYG